LDQFGAFAKPSGNGRFFSIAVVHGAIDVRPLPAQSCFPSTSTRQLDRRSLPQKAADSAYYHNCTISRSLNLRDRQSSRNGVGRVTADDLPSSVVQGMAKVRPQTARRYVGVTNNQRFANRPFEPSDSGGEQTSHAVTAAHAILKKLGV